MRTIYTTESIRIEGVEVLGVDKLHERTRKWVEESRKRLLKEATLPEKITARMMAGMEERPTRQAFFMIRKRCYFLDFFFSRLMLAVEIDGSVHKLKKAHDKKRDADFRSIGIRTLRIKNKDVMNGKFYEKLAKGFFR